MSRHDDYEELFDARSKKHFRQEKKRAILKDRSKFKKTDQDKLKKKRLPPPENLTRGRVFAITPEGIWVEHKNDFISCTLKGALKKEKGHAKNLLAVGDFVHFDPETKSIAFIEERYSVLARAEHHMQKKQQLIAVNIDQVLITASLLHPPLKTTLIDRFAIAARKGNMTPLIIINKVDLLESDIEGVEEEKELFEHFLKTYRELGFALFCVSAKTQEGIEALKGALEGKASVFSGQSGTGKSSLINILTGASREIGTIIAKTRKGSHTTTSAQIIPIAGDGFCIDTPGIKSFGMWDLNKQDIQSYFSEIQEIAKKCRFPDCSHAHEPDCAVQPALEKGKISPLRYQSYNALMASLTTIHRPR